MRQQHRGRQIALSAMVLSLVLVACGGGGGGDSSEAVAGSSASSTSSPSSSSSSAPGSASSSSSSSAASSAPMLSQAGNPIYTELTTYTSWLASSGTSAEKLAADTVLADNMLTWQMPHGGFYKNAKSVYASAWNGSAARSGWTGVNGVELGTIDNDATVTEILFLADVYQRGGKSAHREAARKAMDFILGMQYESGGFPQVYPARTGTTYSNYVTFNDDAMVRVLVLLDHALQKKAPLGDGFFTEAQLAKLQTAIDKAVDFILKAQIVQNGEKTVWCAQHDPVTYAPKEARAYELPSKSGKESVGVVAFLMSRPQTPEVKASVQAAIAWYKSDAVKLANTAYEKTNSKANKTNPFIAQAGSTAWYRFYELNSDTPIFSGRLPNASDCSDPAPFATCRGKQSDIMEIEYERRYGYEWGGTYGDKLFTYSNSVGY
jgi:PelA/Pel-15E family pectate lyase